MRSCPVNAAEGQYRDSFPWFICCDLDLGGPLHKHTSREQPEHAKANKEHKVWHR